MAESRVGRRGGRGVDHQQRIDHYHRVHRHQRVVGVFDAGVVYLGSRVSWENGNRYSAVRSGGAFDNATTITFELVDLNTVSVNGGTVATAGTDRVDNFTVVSVPEPATLALAGLVGLSLMLFRRQRK